MLNGINITVNTMANITETIELLIKNQHHGEEKDEKGNGCFWN